MKKQKKQFKAFTLIELIIIITILAILSVIAFISFQNYTQYSRDGNRVATLKQIEKGLTLYNVKTSDYPEPDEYVEILSWSIILSKQWIIGTNITHKINLNREVFDPKDYTNYFYAITGNNKKYQLWTYLENINYIWYFPQILQTYANTEYKKRHFYTLWDSVWILFDEDTWIPITKEKYLTGLDLMINQDTNFITYFSNDTQSWSVISNGINLIEIIVDKQKVTPNTQIQKTCDGTPNWHTKIFYTTDSVAYSQVCISETFTCNNWIWNHSTANKVDYPYMNCNPWLASNCSQETIEDYILDATNDSSDFHAEKIINITNGTQIYKQIFTCNNWIFSKNWQEELLTPTCNEDYIASGNTCILDSCTGTRPDNSELNGTQWSKSWSWDQTNSWVCKYKCIDWYETLNCTPKIKTVTSADYNARVFTFSSFTLTYGLPETKTSQSLSIPYGTSTLTSIFTLWTDGTTISLSSQNELISCNVWYIVSGANCIENTYVVTFNSDWWSWWSSSVMAAYNNAMPSITLPVKSWCTFNGYFTSINGWGTKYYNANGSSAITYILTNGITLYASWECSMTASGYQWYPITVNWGSGVSVNTFMNHCISLGRKLAHNYWTGCGNWAWTCGVSRSSEYCSASRWCTMKESTSFPRLAFVSSTANNWGPGYYPITYCAAGWTSCTLTNWSWTISDSRSSWADRNSITVVWNTSRPSKVWIPCQ